MPKSSGIENKENLSPIVKLKKLNLNDLLLKGVKIIQDGTLILQEESYLAEEDSESDDSDSPEENRDYTDEDYDPEPKPKLKSKVSKRKRDFIEEESQKKNSDSGEEKPKLKNKVSKRKYNKTSKPIVKIGQEKPRKYNKTSKPIVKVGQGRPRKYNKTSKPMVKIGQDRPRKNLTEYEKLVLKNKEEKMAFLDSLKINEIKKSFVESVEGLKPQRKKLEKRPRSPIIPRESQHRSAKVMINLSEEALEKTATSKSFEPVETAQKVLPAHLKLKDALIGDRLYEDFTEEFNDFDKGTTDPFYDYAACFQNMQLLESSVFVMGELKSASYTMAFHPMREKLIMAYPVSRYGKLAFWNVISDSDPYVFELHSDYITHLKFNPKRSHLIMTSSKDGILKCGDLVKGVFNEVYNVPKEESCTYFEFLSTNTVLLGQKDGNVSAVDFRSTKNSTSTLTHKCHDLSVKSVSVHPLDKNYFISSERKGLVKFWDLRHLQKDPIVQVDLHSNGLELALFSPLSGKSVLTSSMGKVCLFDSSDLGDCLKYQHTLERNLSTAFTKTSRATWLPNTDNAFVVESISYPRKIQIYDDKCVNIFNFTCKRSNRATPVYIFHPSLPVLAGASGNGHIFVLADQGFL